MLFNEPKLLKCKPKRLTHPNGGSFSALQRAEIAEICVGRATNCAATRVSVLFNEPKLLKLRRIFRRRDQALSFSALQRAEIAEIYG